MGLRGNMVALDQLQGPAPLEVRGTTGAPTNTESTQTPIVQPVFATGDAAFLGVSMPTVPAGDAVFPVLSNRPTVRGPHTDSTDATESDGTWTADLLAPSRLQASYIFLRSDAARFPGMAEALRQALSSGLSEAVDAQAIAQIVTDVARVDQATPDTYATYIANLVNKRIDGRYAMTEADIRLLLGSATYADLAATYRANENADTPLRYFRENNVAYRVSPHIPAVAATQQDAIVRRGMRQDAVAPMWQGVEILEDPYTGSGKGEIEITAVLLAAFKVTRTAGFTRQQTDHS